MCIYYSLNQKPVQMFSRTLLSSVELSIMTYQQYRPSHFQFCKTQEKRNTDTHFQCPSPCKRPTCCFQKSCKLSMLLACRWSFFLTNSIASEAILSTKKATVLSFGPPQSLNPHQLWKTRSPAQTSKLKFEVGSIQGAVGPAFHFLSCFLAFQCPFSKGLPHKHVQTNSKRLTVTYLRYCRTKDCSGMRWDQTNAYGEGKEQQTRCCSATVHPAYLHCTAAIDVAIFNFKSISPSR